MSDKLIPGTTIPYENINGSAFSVFVPMINATDGLALGQVCSVTGLEVSTIQNWVKRGYVPHPVKKKYYERHFARILLISALKVSMQIEKIGELMTYVNGDTEDTSDDIISESLLFDYLCETVRELDLEGYTEDEVRPVIEKVISGYSCPDEGAKERLILALMVMVSAYVSGRIKCASDDYFNRLRTM